MKRINALTILIALNAGCAQWFIHGAKLTNHDVAAGQPGGYRVVSCTATDGSVLPVPNTTYHLVTEGQTTQLFERSPNGTGSLIDNQWSADDGRHYYSWVKDTGWEFVVPDGKPPTRIVYLHASELENSDGGVRPTTEPAAKCEMAAL
jgi:hypothetical protein